MDIQTIAIKKARAIVLETCTCQEKLTSDAQVLTLNANMMTLGFIMSQDLYHQLCCLDVKAFKKLAVEVMPILQELKGAHVNHRPMYPNFPKQVIDASDEVLFFNAIDHYYSAGEWLPNYNKLPRSFVFEEVKFQEIKAINPIEFLQLFTQLLKSQDSLSDQDKAIVQWFLKSDYASQLVVPEIPFHENMCLIAAYYLQEGRDLTPVVKNATDLLRIVTHLSGGDVSLAENTRFKSLPRSQRRVLVQQLERVINEEDIGRHRKKWVRLFHNLHVGDYSNKVFKIAKKARNNQHLKSFYSDLEEALLKRDIPLVLKLLQSRPGEFGRRLDHVLRLAMALDWKVINCSNPEQIMSFQDLKQLVGTANQQVVVESFLQVVDKIPTRNLTQLFGHLSSRTYDTMEKIIFPKGSFQNAVVVEKHLMAITDDVLLPLKDGIKKSLELRFSEKEALGKVWLDPALIDCPLPSQQRSASTAFVNMARGTRLPLTDGKDTLRLFVYWVGKDIDLSATFHDEAGNMIEQVSYTQLRSQEYQAYHSGDITNAPKGASEFIDINITAAAKSARYLAMNVLVYNGPNFKDHDECFVGWMAREYSNSNEVYDPATVEQKITLNQGCRNIVPVVFDLLERKAIWVDLPTSSRAFYVNNNVESNAASIQQKLYSILNSRNKLSLYELFEWHINARGEMAKTPEEADITFGLEGDITPFDVNEINANYL